MSVWSVSRALGCVSSHTILDGTNIENPDVIPDMNSGVVPDFQRQDMPDLTADLLEFRRIQGSPADCVVQICLKQLDTGDTGRFTGTFVFRAGR
jgi:hypothetical protein